MMILARVYLRGVIGEVDRFGARLVLGEAEPPVALEDVNHVLAAFQDVIALEYLANLVQIAQFVDELRLQHVVIETAAQKLHNRVNYHIFVRILWCALEMQVNEPQSGRTASP